MHDVQLWLLSAMRHNLGKYREDHYILLTHYRAYPIQGFLVSLCCRLRGLQFFSYQKIILHDVWTKSSFWFDVIFIIT